MGIYEDESLPFNWLEPPAKPLYDLFDHTPPP